MLDAPEKTNWLSIAEQSAWFDKYKIGTNQVTGISIDGFKKFLDATIGKYCENLIKLDKVSCEDEYNQKFVLTDEEKHQLFNSFDLNKDGYIDINGFKSLSEKWVHKIYRRNSAFIIVDVQNDFIDGSLALINGPAEQDGVEVIEVVNKLLDTWTFDIIVYTQDWHPPDHIGFHENLHLRKYRLKDDKNNNTNLSLNDANQNNTIDDTESNKPKFKYDKLDHKANLFDVVLFDDGKIEQKLWPIHCVQNSWGAELHPKLKIVPDAVRILKGTQSNVDAYSAFWDNMHLHETGLRQELVIRDIDDVFVCGLALDYCVASSALDSERAGFKTYVIEDACRGINHDDMAQKRQEMKDRGIVFINSHSIGYHGTKALRAIEWTREFIGKRSTKL